MLLILPTSASWLNPREGRNETLLIFSTAVSALIPTAGRTEMLLLVENNHGDTP
jgi:hypothetical protein